MNTKTKKLKLNHKKTMEAVESAAVKIEVCDPTKQNDDLKSSGGNGSGVIFKKNGPYALILTCGHVVRDSLEHGYPILVTFANGDFSQNFRVVTGMKEADQEVALIFGSDEKLENCNFYSFSNLSKSEVKNYTLIFCSSYPYGIYQPFTVSGRVAQSRVFSTVSAYGFSYGLAVGRGSSGAALIDQRRRIIGLHIQGHCSPVVEREQIQEWRGDEVVERVNETLVGWGEGVVKSGIPISHLEVVLSKFQKDLHSNDNQIYPSCGEKGANCRLFLHFKEEEEERKRREEEEERKMKEEKKRKREKKKRKEKRKKEGASVTRSSKI